MQICQSCGVIAPEPGTTCFVCHAEAAPEAPTAPPPPEGMCWCRLWGHFTCRSCGFQSPINFLDVDGGLYCTHCGVVQAFDVSRWTSVLSHAHEVADLAGPAPETRASWPELVDVGPPGLTAHPQVYSWVEPPEKEGQLELAWACAVGYPLCPSCRAPLQVTGDPQGRVSTVCVQCGQRAQYGSLDEVRQLYPQVAAVLADEHRIDVTEAQEGGDGAAVSVSCPECGAPLVVSGQALLQACDHCGATIRIPARFRSKEVIEPFWLLFQGPSPARREREEAIQRERIEAERMDQHRQDEAERLQAITCPLCGSPTLDEKGWCTTCGHGKPWVLKNPTQTGILAGFLSFLIVAVLDIFVIKPPFPGIGVGFYLIMGAVGSLFLGMGISMAIDPTGHTISTGEHSSRAATRGDGVFFALMSSLFFGVALFLGPILGLGDDEVPADPSWASEMVESPGPTTCAEGNVSQCLAEGHQLEESDPEGAARAFRLACENGSALGCFNQGVMAIRAGDDEAAERLWHTACQLGHSMACANLAGRLVSRDAGAAENPARQACEAGEALGCANLAAVLAERDDLQGAIRFSSQACEAGSVAGCSNLAWYQLNNRQPIDALQTATRAVDMDPNHLAAREHLGYALMLAGDENRAVEELGQAVALSRNQVSANQVIEDRPRVEEIRDKLRLLRQLYPRRRRSIQRIQRRQREWGR